MALFGVPWVNFSRILLQFDLNKIPKGKRVASATLKLQVGECTNPEKLLLEVSPIAVEWTDAVDWNTSDGEKKWPSTRESYGYGNIDFGVDKAYARDAALEEGKTVEVDVTDIVKDWISGTLPNRGLLLKMGPTIFGVPENGPWRVLFDSLPDHPGTTAVLLVK